MNKLIFLLGLSLLFFVNIQAQNYQWEAGVNVGGANYLGDLTAKTLPYFSETGLTYGAHISYNFNKKWAVLASAKMLQLSGADINLEEDSFNERNLSFNSSLFEGALLARWEPLGAKRYNEGGAFNKIISPYLFLGAGLNSGNPEVDFTTTFSSTSFQSNIKKDENAIPQGAHFVVPFGGGLRIDLSSSVALDLELGARYTANDLIDGISQTGNPDANDWYVTGGINLIKRFGNKDSDGDGLIDDEDLCPTIKGDLSARGCPDGDGDGVEDAEDVCPFNKGRKELNGCPDLDGDGLSDKEDECPKLFGTMETGGCPDTDNDGIKDSMDACPEVAGLKNTKGCPDTDEDGLADKEDNCPLEKGDIKLGGCPDSDGDGVINTEDECPSEAGIKNLAGCPDSDGDGVADKKDKCPELEGSVTNEGCPKLSEEEKEVIANAIDNVEFKTGSAELKESSKKILDNVAEVLENNPYYFVAITGHTDNVGNEENNLKLSTLRAQACYGYLVAKGIDSKRLAFEGKGESQPIADNATAAGRQKNRRVDFDLKLK